MLCRLFFWHASDISNLCLIIFYAAENAGPISQFEEIETINIAIITIRLQCSKWVRIYAIFYFLFRFKFANEKTMFVFRFYLSSKRNEKHSVFDFLSWT